jgi:TetR/AcrR family transcriptional repressor of nem operon
MMKDCQTRGRLLRTALDLIWHASYDSVGVDEICRKARINKGSFYHFFPSKTDLAVVALEEYWDKEQLVLDQIFSPQIPALERLMKYCDSIYKFQKEQASDCGCVCGCPFTSVGSEQCLQNEKLKNISEKMLLRLKKYLASALKDAQDEGLIEVRSVDRKVNELFSYYLGALTQARIYNDLKFIAVMKEEFMDILEIDPKRW